MANNLIQVKRTSVSGRAANSTTLPNPGELALNMTDGILYSTNGSVVFEVGANNTNAKVTNTLTVNAISANGGVGANNQSLTSNGSSAYWKDPILKDLVDVAANGATDTQVLTYNSTLNKWVNQNPPVANVVYTTGYYGYFSDTDGPQYGAGNNVATVLRIDTPVLTNGITRTSNNELQVAYAGVYQFIYSIQFENSSSKNENIRVWLRKNGTDVANSGSDFGIYPVAGGANGFLIAATPLVENVAAGDKFQIMWSTADNTAIVIASIAATANSPFIPGALVSVTPVSNIITAPPGANTDVTFNDSGLANGAAGLTYNKTTNSVTVANNLFIGNVANAQAFTVDGSFTANSTVVNAASFTVDGNFSANSTMVNAAALLVRGGATVNGQLTLNDGLSANGGLGTTGQVLFTDGTKAYWNSASFGGGPGVNSDAQYVWTNTHTFQNTVTFGNSTVNATINSTFFTATANNTSFVGSVSAANVVSNAQLSGNLANYQTTAGLSANVATLTSNNATHAFSKTEGQLNVNSAVYANNSTYVYGKVEGDLNVNSSIYANNSTYAYGKIEGDLSVNNAAHAYGKTEGNLNVNSSVYANNSTYAFGKSEGQLNVNSAVNANNSAYAYGKTEDNLNVNSAVYANNSTYAYGKTEGNLNVNNALTANYASYVNANTGIVSNSSGVFVNAAYIDTLGASTLGGAPAANFVQNTDSRIMSGNLQFTSANNVFDVQLKVNTAVINSTGVYAANLYGNLTGNVVATTISGNLTGNVSATTISGNLTGNVVATTVNTATLNATSNIVVGANVSINTSVISVGNSTANVYVNSTAFVGNVFATSLSGNLSGNVTATAISGNLTGNVVATTISGNLTAVTANVTNKLQIGTPGAFDFGSNAVIEIDADGNTYVQVVLQNGNTGNNASADLVVTNDQGNDSFGYVDLGINGSNYNQPGYDIVGAGDAYLYSSDGNLSIGTKSNKELVLHAGGATAADRRFTVNSTAIAIANAAALVANGSSGTSGQILTSNSTGVYWSSSANNADNLGGTAAASYQLNSTLNANIASYLPTYTGVVNASTLQVGTNFVANSTQVTAADLLVTGNLIVNGTTVTLNTATLDVKDLNITLAKGTASAAAANGAGITVDVANAEIVYVNAGNTWLSNVNFGVGNSTSNVSINSTAFVGNVVATSVTGNLIGNVSATTLSGNLTGNVAAVTITGNLTGNVAATTITGNLTGNVIATTISGNLTGNVIATTISGNLSGNVVATTVNTTTINATANIVVGANVLITTANLAIGNSTANVYVNSTSFVGNVSATSISGNLTGNVVATSISGNLTGNVSATTISGNLTGNVSATTLSASANISVGANVLITTANLAIGNSTANVYANSTAFVGNVVATSLSGNLSGNVVATTISGNLTGNVAATTISGNLTGNVVATNVNAATIQVSSSITLDNDRSLRFKTVNTSAFASFVQQSDDNFVMYTTNTTYGQRPVFSIFANSDTSYMSFSAPVLFNTNVNLGTATVIANGGTGTAGQVLTTNGSATYWSTGTVNTAAQYNWSNIHTFSANVSFTGNGIGIASNTGAIYLGGIADANWKIARNSGVVTKWKYTNNTIDIVTANSNLEGMVIGLVNGNSYFETGYLGTFIAANTTVGNSTSNVTINSTAFVGNVVATTISGNLTGNVAAITISGNLTGNVAATTITGNLTGNVVATTVNATTINATSNVVVGANVSLNTSTLAIGNSTANVFVNSTAFVGNVVATTISGNLSGNVVATTISGNLTGNVAATTLSGNLSAITANVTNKLQIGAPGAFDFGSNAVVEIDGNGNTYVQSVIQNANTGNNASADLVVTNDTGNDSFNYVDLGINGSNYNQPGFSISGPSDAYLYASDGALAIGTLADKEIIFHAAGATTSDRKFTINATAVTIANAAALVANGSTGTSGQILTSNSTGVYWSSSANNALNLGGVAAASYQLNSTLNANIASYLPTYTGTVNASTFQVGTNFVANSTQVTTADLLVTGNLIVNGTTVTLNTATLDVKDLNITLAKGTASAAAANGAGITVDAANATLLYVNAGNTWLSNINFGVGNSTSNVSINSTAFIGNVVATSVSGNLTGNVTATALTGNLTGNVVAITISGNLTGNVAATTISGNLTGNVAATTISGNLTGNVIATTISGNLTGNVVATTVNATTVNATSNVVVGANVTLNTSALFIGNTSVNSTVNSTVFSGTSNNALNLNGVAAASYVQNTDSRVLSGNLVFTGANTTMNAEFRVVNSTANVFFAGANGNVGIGNTAPAFKLRVEGTTSLAGAVSDITTLAAGNTTITGFANVSGNVNIGSSLVAGSVLIGSAPTFGHAALTTIVYGTAVGKNYQLAISPIDGALGRESAIRFGSTFSDGWAGTDYVSRYSGSIAYGAQGGTAYPRSYAMKFLTGDSADEPTERMRIDNTGLGIGNTTPAHRLRVEGTSSLAGAVSDITTLAAGNTTISGFINVSTTAQIGGNLTLASTSAIIANSSAGTTGQVLTTNGSAVYWSTVSGVNTAAQYTWSNTHLFNANVSVNSVFTVVNSTANVFFAGANGNVGIGNSSPVSKLDVYGNYSLIVVAVAASDVDCSLGNFFTKTISGTTTFTFSNVPANRAYGFVLELTNGGSSTVNWPIAVKWPSGTAPTLTAAGVDVLTFITDDGGTTWRGLLSMGNSS